MEEIPFCGSLNSLIFDPLDISADEESPLIQELRTIEGYYPSAIYHLPEASIA